MRISPLDQPDLAAIHEVFLRAFSDYPIPMEPSPDELRKLLELRGVSFPNSFGAYVDGQLVGVWMAAVGKLNEARTAYTVFTGIVPEHRSRGLGQALFQEVVALLREADVRRVVHEVLSENERAIRAYRKMGFRIRRELVCLKTGADGLKNRARAQDAAAEIVPAHELEPQEADACRDWLPTWPCADETIARAEVAVQLAAREAGELVGYAVALPTGGSLGLIDVAQIAVLPTHRRRGIATKLLSTVATMHPEAGGLRVLNVDASAEGDRGFWSTVGAVEFTRQYEMEWIDGA